MPRGVSTCEILIFPGECFQKYQAQKTEKPSFLVFLGKFLNFFPSKHTALEDVSVKCPKTIELVYRRFS